MKKMNYFIKGIFSIVLLSLLVVTSISSYGQKDVEKKEMLKYSDKVQLEKMRSKFSQKYIKEKQKAKEMAKEKGWFIRKKLEDGTIIELQRIDEKGNPVYYSTHNVNAAKTLSTNEVWEGSDSGLDLTGKGIEIGEWDGGAALKTHQEFIEEIDGSRIIVKDNSSSSDHSTHVAGTMIGAGVNSDAKGMASEGSILSYDYNNDISEMIEAGMEEGLLLSNHSYGRLAGYFSSSGGSWSWAGDTEISTEEDYGFGFYGEGAMIYDSIAHELPYYLIVKSSGNDHGQGPADGDHQIDGGNNGYDCIGWVGNAKNILTVGAVKALENGYTGNPSDVEIADFSSRGPSDDGRIKPDIVGNGVQLYSASNMGTDIYRYMSGTSMSAPNVTGSLALLQEHWNETQNLFMRSATLKGLAIHTADEAGANDGPDYKFGWGLMNTREAARVISERNVHSFIRENTLKEGNSKTLEVNATGDEPLVVTMVWTDPAGTPPEPALDPRDTMLVNDLDVTVTNGSNDYYPYKLDPENPAQAAETGDNDVDNVEKVVVESPDADTYTISIEHEGALKNGEQDYSLIVTGIQSDFSPETQKAYEIGQDTAKVDAKIHTNTKLSVSEKGIVYNTSGEPNISDSVAANGSGTGSFTTTLYNLTPYKKYYARAYAKTSQGVIYGNTKTFTTLPWQIDAKADSLLNPVKTISVGQEKIRFKVKNIGFDTIQNLDVEWQIDSEFKDTSTWTGTLPQDSSAEISVGPYNFPSKGVYNFSVNILNVNNTEDPYKKNDTIKGQVEVIRKGELFEDFESSDFLPRGWSETADANNWQRASSDFDVQIEGHDAIIGQKSGDPKEKLITPKLSINDTTPDLEFTVAGLNNTY
ncbi:MAG: S8 family serine peptidase, partial [Bacteroidota bacterium]